MPSINKRNKAKNSFCKNLDSLKNSVLEMKLKRILFYTSTDRQNNKKIKIDD